MQTLGELGDEQFEFRIFQITILHFLNQGIHDLQGILLQEVSMCGLLLVHIEQIILVDLTHQRRLDLLDALLREIALFGVGRKNDHVYMNVFLFHMHGGIPSEVVGLDLIALGYVNERRLN